QDADAEGRVSMVMMRLRRIMAGGMAVAVHMNVAGAIVFVFVRVNFEGFAQSPTADADQHDAHESFAPGGNEVYGDQVTQPKREQTDHSNSRGMANAPAHSGNPGSFRLPHRQRSDGGQVVRAGQNM